MEKFSLAGRVALVTGASRGLGLAMATGLAEAGAMVVLNGRNPTTLEHAAESLRARSFSADIACFDVADRAAIRDAIDTLVKRRGTLDILIANAGTHGARPLPDWTEADWARVMHTNLDACFWAAQAAAIPMIAQKHGRIIFTGSLTASRGRPTIHGYAASKAGLAAITRTMAAELGPEGVTVNTIAGGYFVTDLSAGLRADPDMVARITARVPVRRWGVPEDLAGIAVLLASDAGSYITGQEIAVDGGLGTTL